MISENLIELILVRTEVKALPSSINNLTQLLHLDVRLCKNLQTIPKLSQFLKTLLASFSESLQSLPELPLSLETVHVKNWTSISTLPQFPPFLKTLEAGDCTSLKTLWSFPSTADEQLKENRKQETGSVRELLERGRKYSSGYWVECTNQRDEICKPPPDFTKSQSCWKLQWYHNYCSYQAIYIYSGSSVAEWLEYTTTKNYTTIDLSSAPPSPPRRITLLGKLEFVITISVSDGENEGKRDSLGIYIDYLNTTSESDNVCVMYDQRWFGFLNSRAEKTN